MPRLSLHPSVAHVIESVIVSTVSAFRPSAALLLNELCLDEVALAAALTDIDGDMAIFLLAAALPTDDISGSHVAPLGDLIGAGIATRLEDDRSHWTQTKPLTHRLVGGLAQQMLSEPTAASLVPIATRATRVAWVHPAIVQCTSVA